MERTFSEIVIAYLVTVNKDREWLLQQTGFSLTAWRNWANGYKNPSLDAINSIALVLKNAGANIWTPKQLMPESLKFSFTKSKAVGCNIEWLCNNYGISQTDIYNDSRFKLNKNSVINVLVHGQQPGYENLQKFTEVFKKLGKGNIKSPIDLVYFPIPWAETEISYQEFRNKIKLI